MELKQTYQVYHRDTGRLIGSFTKEQVIHIGFKLDDYILIEVPQFLGFID
jgi:hypothetical protein